MRSQSEFARGDPAARETLIPTSEETGRIEPDTPSDDQKTPRLFRWLGELKRRRVYRAVASYAVAAFVIMQVVNEFAPALRLPSWTSTLVAVLLLVGFPMILALAWAFDWTPEGLERAEAGSNQDDAAMAHRSLTKLGGVAALTVLLVGTGVWMMVDALGVGDSGDSRLPATTGTLDPGMVAVLPFRVSGAEELRYLEEGMVDLLAAKFTGEGGLEAVEPRTVLTFLPSDSAGDEVGAQEALTVARRTGAGKAILGSVVPTGRELVISARLMDAAREETLARSTVEGPTDSLPSLVDRLAGELLSLQAGEATESIGSLTTTSLPALRAYLEARRDFRAGRFQEAVEKTGRALDIDSTFVLAALTQIEAAGFTTGAEPRATRVAQRGYASLSRKDRTYLESMVGPKEAGDVSWQFYRDRVPYLERAVEVLPDRPAAWYRLGDLYYHWGAYMGIADWEDRAWGYFRRALTLDSLFTPAGLHMADLALHRGDTITAIRETERLLDANPQADFSSALTWFAARLEGNSVAADRALDRAIREAPATALSTPMMLTLHHPFPVEDGDRLAEALAERSLSPSQAVILDSQVFSWHLERGRPTEAEEQRQKLSRALSPEFAASLAILAALHSVGLEEPAREGALYLENQFPGNSEQVGEDGGEAAWERCSLSLWHAARGESGRALRVAEALNESQEKPGQDATSASLRNRFCSLLIRTRVLKGPERLHALELADSISRRGPAFGLADPIDGVQARVLAEGFREAGRPERALEASKRVVYGLPASYFIADLLALRAELAEAVAGPEAGEPYRRQFIHLRKDAPSLINADKN